MNKIIIHELGHLIMYLIILTKYSINKEKFAELIQCTFQYITVNGKGDYGGLISVANLYFNAVKTGDIVLSGSFFLGGVFFGIYYFKEKNKIDTTSLDSIRNLIIDQGGRTDLRKFDEYLDVSEEYKKHYYMLCMSFIENAINNKNIQRFLNKITPELNSKKILYPDDIVRISKDYFDVFRDIKNKSFDGTKFKIKFNNE